MPFLRGCGKNRVAHRKGMPMSQKTVPSVTGDCLPCAFIPSVRIYSALAYSRHCPGPLPRANKWSWFHHCGVSTLW